MNIQLIKAQLRASLLKLTALS